MGASRRRDRRFEPCLSRLDDLAGVLSAVLAVLVWPLVLLEAHVVI